MPSMDLQPEIPPYQPEPAAEIYIIDVAAMSTADSATWHPEDDAAATSLIHAASDHTPAVFSNEPAVTEALATPTVTDTELADLLVKNIETLGAEPVDRILAENLRSIDPGARYPDPLMPHKRLLRVLPVYTATAERAQLGPEQTEDLLLHAMRSVRYPTVDNHDLTVLRVAGAVNVLPENSGSVPTEAIDRLKDLISIAASYDNVGDAAATFTAARHAGLSVDDSAGLVQCFMDSGPPWQVAMHFSRFREALQALSIADVPPGITQETFAVFDVTPAGYRGDLYEDFIRAIQLCPQVGLAPADMMRSYVERVRSGESPFVSLSQVIDAAKQAKTESAAGNPQDAVQQFFISRPGPLANALLPYRTRQTFADGLRDIEHLTAADSRLGDIVSAASWVFDPQTDTWYSLGGRTIRDGPTPRHVGGVYDLSDLSQTPCQVTIRPTQLARDADMLLFAMPSAADLTMVADQIEKARRPVLLQSFISHQLGITEFTTTSTDPVEIRRAAATLYTIMRDIKTLFPEVTLLDAIDQWGGQAAAQDLISYVNRHMPPGFLITLYPPGSDTETLLQRRTT